MTAAPPLVIRDVRLASGDAVDVSIRAGSIDAIGFRLPVRGEELDGRGRTIIPGLVDHHLHLFATAARMRSVDLTGAKTGAAVAARISADPSPGWVRAIGYDERAAGLLDKAAIDAWEDRRPVRIQDRTGALWMLNSAALRSLGPPPYPDCVECDGQGAPTGRIWRGDAWLRTRLDDPPPSLAALSTRLAAMGVTAVTDAGASNGPAEAALFDAAIREGDLVQHLTLMGREDLPASEAYARGPLKLLYDERDLPDVEHVAARIRTARAQDRPVAAHCVTTGELLFFLAALDHAGGALPGDRIEHGSVIPASLIGDIAARGLTVVTQPGFIFERGDRYLREIEAEDLPDLYRLASLRDAGIPIAAGSDAPYGDVDPWIGIRAAQNRTTNAGDTIGATEALCPRDAHGLYSPLGLAGNPPPGATVAVGMSADLCLLDVGAAAPVAATLIAGRIVHLV
jgi:predicted amidohydrolase YtcJ